MKPVFLALLCISLTGGGLVAQGPDDPGGTTGDVRAAEGVVGAEGGISVNVDRPLAPKTHFEQRATGLVEVTRLSNGQVSERKVPMEEARRLRREKKVPRIRANNLCRGTAHPSPRRLAPGQAGTLRVLITLGGKAVAVPSPAIVLAMNPSPGLKFGQPVLQPASVSKRPGKYEGQRIYDDFLLFDVPVTVEPGTKPQKIGVSGLCDLELYHQKSGALLGDYTAEVGGSVLVGTPLPTHNLSAVARPQAKATEAEAPVGEQPEEARTAPKPAPAGAEPTPDPNVRESGRMAVPADGRDARPGESVAEPAGYAVEDASGSLFLIGGGGLVAVLLIGLLLLRRR